MDRKKTTRVVTVGMLCVLTVALSAQVSGCAGTSELTGADAVDLKRDGALAVFVNRKVTDQVNVSDGDGTDWKYVDIPRPGEMSVTVAFDSPRGVTGEVVLRDNFATVIERHELTQERSVYEFAPVQAVSSRYYIEILAESGSSVYTVGVDLAEPVLAGFGSSGSFDREGLDDQGGRRVGTGTRKPKEDKVTKNDPDPQTAENPDPDPTPTGGEEEGGEEEEVEPAATIYTVNGYIQRVIPLDDGGTLLHIQLSGEGLELVKTGTTGKIAQIGAVVRVQRRSGSYATAVTQADAEDCKVHKNVTFTVSK